MLFNKIQSIMFFQKVGPIGFCWTPKVLELWFPKNLAQMVSVEFQKVAFFGFDH